MAMSETESQADDLWQQHLEEVGEKLNADADQSGFLRMVNRDHVWNASSYSMASQFSIGAASIASSVVNKPNSLPPLAQLYDLLIAPLEEVLPPSSGHLGCRQLVLVLQGDLYLVPFAILRRNQTAAALCERYSLLVAPSIHTMRTMQLQHQSSDHYKYDPDDCCLGALVVGNPRIPRSVTTAWQWQPLPVTEMECRLVGEMLGTRALMGSNATKDHILQQLAGKEVLHFASHISWRLAAVVLSASDLSTTSSVQANLDRMDLSDSNSDIAASSIDGPPLSDFLLTAADILTLRLNARLVVLSSGYSDERAGRINTDGVVGLTRAFLMAGVHCVLFSLWPVPDIAARALLKLFYTAVLQGSWASQALSDAMKSLQTNQQFAHPSNWAGWVLVGHDVQLNSKVALMGYALSKLLKTPSKSREAMRVLLHLVRKRSTVSPSCVRCGFAW